MGGSGELEESPHAEKNATPKTKLRGIKMAEARKAILQSLNN
jgi:hypothetical protein